MIINGRQIGKAYEPYIVAELSANHGGSIDRAKESISRAASAGVSAIKIQSYTPDTMTIKCEKPDFYINDGLWAGSDLHDLYQSAYTPFEWHADLFNHAKAVGITLFSTPFDETAVDLLEDLDTPAYKIASFEITDLPLVEYVARRNKPILLSTGMASLDEIRDAVEVVRRWNDAGLLLFHCISSYPTPTEQSHLENMRFLRENFDVEVGLSDHTISNLASTVAIGMGAVAIEKHFKLDEKECGPDSSFSLNIDQLTNLVGECREAWKAKGSAQFRRAQVEQGNMVFRRSLYFVEDLDVGDEIKKEHIRRIRPGYGVAPKYLEHFVGKRVAKSVERGDRVVWDVVD